MDKTSFWQLLDDTRIIEIPVIQRDYVQGREDDRTRNIAKRFVNSIKKAIVARLSHVDSEPLILDFIFGSIDSGSFIPFDGQQRLTTLWLVYLYVATRENVLHGDVFNRLDQFRYAVREDSALFSRALLKFMAELSADPAQWNQQSLKQLVKDQPWFLPQWNKDTTINGMLNMLEYIDGQFSGFNDLWRLLTLSENCPVMFYFQDIEELKTGGDELFIKMNARGKQLTEFEIFKARFLDWLEINMPAKKASFTKYLNQDWQDLFWKVFGKTSTKKDKAVYADECFCNFLRWFADMLLKYPPNSAIGSDDLFDMMVRLMQPGAATPASCGNLALLEAMLNELLRLEAAPGGISGFFEGIFLASDDNTMPEPEKISWFRINHVNMFYEICAGNPTLPDREMFFACLLALAVKKELKADDREHLRILRNLLANSTSENYEAKLPELMPALVELILNGKITPTSALNTLQLNEERVKQKFRQTISVSVRDNMDWLEDHPLLRGCLAMFTEIPGSRETPAFEASTVNCGKLFFEKTLGKDYKWDTALKGFLTCGEFGLQDSPQANKYMYLGAQINNNPLDKRNIFITTRPDSFSRIRHSVQELAHIVGKSHVSAEKTIEERTRSWLSDEEKLTWRWYFAKYASMRPDATESCGRYDWGYSLRSFQQRELAKKILVGPHWNPFLWAVYVEAGFDNEEERAKFKNKIDWQDSDDYGYDTSQIIFTIDGTKLAMWPYEFFWWVNGPSARLGQKAAQKLAGLRDELAAHHVKMLEDGTCFIKGVDSASVDYSNFSWESVQGIYRLYDTEDRIKKGVKIAQALANL